MRKFNYPQVPSTGISKLLLVGAIIWAIPLVWHYKQKQKEQQDPAQEQEPFEYQ